MEQRVWAFLQVVILNILFTGLVHAQEELTGTTDTTCVQKELGDLIRNALDKAPKGLDTTSVGSVLLIPIIGSNPATGFMFGVGGQYAFKLGKADTKYSLLSGSVQFTTKKQTLFLLKATGDRRWPRSIDGSSGTANRSHNRCTPHGFDDAFTARRIVLRVRKSVRAVSPRCQHWHR